MNFGEYLMLKTEFNHPYFKLTLAVFLGCYVGTFPIGLNQAKHTFLTNIWLTHYNTTSGHHNHHHDQGPIRSQSSTLKQDLFLTVGIGYGLASILGSLILPFVVNRLGRAKTVFIVAPSVFIAASLFGLVQDYGPFVIISGISAVLFGVGVGISYGAVSMWLIESSPHDYHGLLGSLMNTGLAVGLFITSLVHSPLVLGNYTTWPYLLVVALFIIAAMAVGIKFIPDSPKYLYLVLNDADRARNAIRFYYGPNAEPNQILHSYEQEETSTLLGTAIVQPTFMEIIRCLRYRKPVIISALLGALPSSMGWFALLLYANRYAVDPFDVVAGQKLELILVSLILITAIVAPFIVQYSQRKLLLLLTSTAICCLQLAIFISINVMKRHPYSNYNTVKCILVALTTVMYNIGPGPIIPFLSTELSPQELRPIANSVLFTSYHLGYLITLNAFQPTKNAIDEYIFLLFVIISIIILVYLKDSLPETKDKMNNEIIRKWMEHDQQVSVLQASERTPLLVL